MYRVYVLVNDELYFKKTDWLCPFLHCSHVGCVCKEGYSGNFCEYYYSSNGKNSFGAASGLVLTILILGLAYIIHRGRSKKNARDRSHSQQFFPITQEISTEEGEDPIREIT